jgi:hypothetical protein
MTTFNHNPIAVIVADTPSPALVDQLLAPFQFVTPDELDNEYLKDVDILEEARENFEQAHCTMLRDSKGEYHHPKHHYRQLTEEEMQQLPNPLMAFMFKGYEKTTGLTFVGGGYVINVPDGWEIVSRRVPDHFELWQWFEDHGLARLVSGMVPDYEDKHQGGYFVTDGEGNVTKAVKRANPNAKWDGYDSTPFTGIMLHVLDDEEDVVLREYEHEGCFGCRIGNLDYEAMGRHQIQARQDLLQAAMDQVNAVRLMKGDPELENSKIMKLWGNYVQHDDYIQSLWQSEPDEQKNHEFMNKWIEKLAEKDKRVASVMESMKSSVLPVLQQAGMPKERDLGRWCKSAPFLPITALVQDGKWIERDAEETDESWFGRVSDTLRAADQNHHVVVVDAHLA